MKKIILILLISFVGLSTTAQKQEKKKKKDKKELKAGAETSKNKLLLRYNLKKGEGYEQVFENEVKMKIMDMEIPMTQKITTRSMIIEVDASGNFTRETTIEKFYMKQTNPIMGDLEYDSEDTNKQSPILAEQLGKMKGTKSTEKISPTGKEESTSKTIAVANTSSQYPEQPVAVGDTWESTITTQDPNLKKEFTSNNQYKLVERNAGKAIVEVNSKIVSDGKEVGTASGKMTIDEATGIVLESTLVQKMNMEVQGMQTQVETNIKLTGKKL